MNDPIDYAVYIVLGLASAFVMYVFFVVMPVSMYADAKCLEAGYPKSSVTWNLHAYCIGLDGSTRTEVQKLK